MAEKKAKKAAKEKIAHKAKEEAKVEKHAGQPKEKGKPAEAKEAHEAKAEKKEAKAGKKEAEKAAKKEEKPQKAKKPKPLEIKKIAEKIKKKHRIMFRGRFGKRGIRKVSNEKWQRWRAIRGIDMYTQKEDGAYPKTGYKTPRAIRGRHPSGYIEVLVRNEGELEKAAKEKQAAVKFASALGKRKRQMLLEKADKLGIIVLNG